MQVAAHTIQLGVARSFDFKFGVHYTAAFLRIWLKSFLFLALRKPQFWQWANTDFERGREREKEK